MVAIVSQIPVAPIAAMPEPLQTIFFWVTMVAAIGTLGFGIRLSQRHQSIIPVLMVIAAFFAIALEAPVGFLGHVFHPAIGSIALYSATDRTIPWHIAFGYVFGFGTVYLIFFNSAMKGTITPWLIWKTAIISTLCYYFGEIAGVSTGLWVYFEPSPLWPWKMTSPITWSFLDASSMVLGGALMVFLLPRLQGWKQIFVLPLGPIGAFMGHFGAGFAFYDTINSAAPRWAMELSGVSAVLFSLLVWWISAILATSVPRPESA